MTKILPDNHITKDEKVPRLSEDYRFLLWRFKDYYQIQNLYDQFDALVTQKCPGGSQLTDNNTHKEEDILANTED